MKDVAASIEHVVPRPRKVRLRTGVFRSAGGAVISSDGGDLAAEAAQQLAARLRAVGMRWCVQGAWHRSGAGRSDARIMRVEEVKPPPRPHADQGYSLLIRPEEVVLRATGTPGFLFGIATLGQLIAAGRGAIRAMEIEDWPDYAVRGVMLDISRDKVPTMETLRRLVDRLAGWKINQLQLYTEHTFAYAGHERVWRGASPMTGLQIENLDRYCRERGVELVPNQNSFGHLERWLKHPPYARLAEAIGPWRTPFGDYRDWRTTLNPLDPASIRFIESLYDQLLPHFDSHLFNAGCDETWELGQGHSAAACRRRGLGRVYLDFVLKIHRALRRRGRRMMFWADIAQQHPGLTAELPDDLIPLIWGYEADHPFDAECARVARRGLEFYVCPGTSSWCSFGGRTRNCLENIRNAAAAGRRHGASGYLITDWGDFGHRQYLPVSYPGFLFGAAMSWCADANAGLDVPRELSRHVFGDSSGACGRLWSEAGAIHELSGVNMKNRTILFAYMQASLADWASIGRLIATETGPAVMRKHDHALAHMERRATELLAEAGRIRGGGDDGDLVDQELQATLTVLRHACRRGRMMLARHSGEPEREVRRECRGLAADMGQIIERHRALWLARNRRGGLASSLAYFRRNWREYERGQ